jgi:lysophosphatidylcholine acyltransferase/lyso-PAF acetyltransferase
MLASVSAYSIDLQNCDLDYKKYLGPGSKQTFENPSTIVSNHQCMMDICVHTLRQTSSHVAKASILRMPFVGPVTDALGGLFFERGDKKSSKDILTLIGERQKLCEQGLYSPLVIYPEGGTTNGSSIISFKKGAFASLRSI